MPKPTQTQVNSTQKYLNIAAIRDGLLALKDGNLRVIMEVSSLNFDLKSEDEQNGVIGQYQNFLNSLKFPIQIIVQSRKLDLFNYLKFLRQTLEKQTNDLIRIQTEDYITFIERLLTKANIMDKKFYVVVPFFPTGVEKVTFIDKILGSNKTGEIHYTEKQFAEYKEKLMERANVVIGGLGSLGLRVKILGTQEIIEMMYAVYNPDEAMNQRMVQVEELGAAVIRKDGVLEEAVAESEKIKDKENNSEDDKQTTETGEEEINGQITGDDDTNTSVTSLNPEISQSESQTEAPVAPLATESSQDNHANVNLATSPVLQDLDMTTAIQGEQDLSQSTPQMPPIELSQQIPQVQDSAATQPITEQSDQLAQSDNYVNTPTQS